MRIRRYREKPVVLWTWTTTTHTQRVALVASLCTTYAYFGKEKKSTNRLMKMFKKLLSIINSETLGYTTFLYSMTKWAMV